MQFVNHFSCVRSRTAVSEGEEMSLENLRVTKRLSQQLMKLSKFTGSYMSAFEKPLAFRAFAHYIAFTHNQLHHD